MSIRPAGVAPPVVRHQLPQTYFEEVGTHAREQVVAFEDRGDEHAPLPPPDPLRNFHTPPTLPPALPLKPISITQPDGPSWHLVRMMASRVYGVGSCGPRQTWNLST